jgi:endoglucanase
MQYSPTLSLSDLKSYNTDVYLGWIGWAAGAFSASYELSEVPTYANGIWTDTGIVKNCVAGKFK